jgi:hypothetical protein
MLLSCGQTDERPPNLISESKMVEVMVDTHIFEAMAEGRNLLNDTLARFVKKNYGEIFRENGITEDQFLRTFDYYEHNPGKMDELMTKVIDELSKMEASVKGKEETK